MIARTKAIDRYRQNIRKRELPLEEIAAEGLTRTEVTVIDVEKNKLLSCIGKLDEKEKELIQHSRKRDVAVTIKNEVLEMIAKVAERKDRLDLPIVKGKYLYKMTDRTALQSADNAVKFVNTRRC